METLALIFTPQVAQSSANLRVVETISTLFIAVHRVLMYSVAAVRAVQRVVECLEEV